MKLCPIGHELKLLANRFEAAANKNLMPLGLTTAQAQLLIILNNSTDTLMPQKKLEKAVGASQATITGIISRLNEKKLVALTRDGEDRRVQLVAITPEGIALCESAFFALRSAETEIFKKLSADELKTFKSLFSRLTIPDNSQANDQD